jgi:hypothetical protein
MKQYIQYSVVQEVEFNIEGRTQTVQLAIDYTYGITDYYWVSAITETGFDLCTHSYGYFKSDVQVRNTRLRSEASIVADMVSVLDDYIYGIQSIEQDIILTEKSLDAKISDTECFIFKSDVHFFPASNIHGAQSGLCLSWHEHDVFNQGPIVVTAYRTKEGQLLFKADESALYDLSKLKQLMERDAFKSSKLAFFNYNECRRLMGMPVDGDPKRMSGLMPSDRTE